jgi:NAD-dependent deacetylase
MEKRIPDFTLITQNVDGLHHLAGSKKILELHGNILNVRCSKCGAFTDDWSDKDGAVPRCKRCDGLLRPDVVWFEESLPREQLEAAVKAARNCQVFFSIGTSGVVQPAAALAHAAKDEGAVIVEINGEPTTLTPRVDFAFHGKSGEILPELAKAVWG